MNNRIVTIDGLKVLRVCKNLVFLDKQHLYHADYVFNEDGVVLKDREGLGIRTDIIRKYNYLVGEPKIRQEEPKSEKNKYLILIRKIVQR